MAGSIKKFLQISVIAAIIPQFAMAVQAPNPRVGGVNVSSIRKGEAESSASVRRSATSVIARTTSVNARKNRPVVVSRATVSRSVNNPTNAVRSARKTENVVLNKSGLSRSAKKTTSLARSAANAGSKKLSSGGFSRAASSRATAVFNDISKIGGGYGSCRDAYATCMDQFCANANDTYRRCYCSDRFTEFRETAESLDTALRMLAEFQDNNLNAVDKTAAEVNAMYSASAGEAAIKRDTSASQQLLDSISDVLSGKKKTQAPQTSLASMGVLDLSGFSSGLSGDIWGDNGGVSLFGEKNDGVDMTKMEGKELYNQSNSQCSEIIREACKGDAIFNMAKSAYSIMITQDCNAYQKNIDAKKVSVEETVRTAEKYLREARLEEYRAHNSQDVNECLNKVETAMLQPTACGDNYNKCLDYTGRYINSTTGEPIYSKALLKLNELIVLDGSADVAAANKEFDDFLESKKIFANTALDTCRDIADTVWYEFKRSAIIQIAQAQDEKIEEVKSSCVSTMKECYDEQTGALASFDDTSAQATGALSAITSHDMCADKVMACAALYGDPDGCVYEDKSKTLRNNGSKTCGLTSLLAFVNTVDSVKVAEGCEKSLQEYAQEICSPSSGDTEHAYPWGCRLKSYTELKDMFEDRADLFCGGNLIGDNDDSTKGINVNIVDTDATITKILDDIKDSLVLVLGTECVKSNGVWIASEMQASLTSSVVSSTDNIVKAFYANVFNGNVDGNKSYGICAENTTMTQCLNQNTADHEYATYDASSMTCNFTDEWYQNKCVAMGGYYKNAVCYLPKG